jgi:uncharacterized protein (TIGR02246 family)
MSEESSDIRKVWEAYAAAVTAADRAGFAAALTEDIVFSPPDQSAVVGRAAVEKWAAQSLFDPFAVRMTFQIDELEASGPWAWARGHFTNHMTPASGGAPITASGDFLNVFRRSADGSWKFARVSFNYDAPLAVGESL